MNKVKHLENLCVINADFDIWSGQTRLSESDFKLGTGGEIPPEKIAQLGSKKICDPAKLKGFHRLKTETRRFLLSYGMPFMNGYAVPAAKADEISKKLDKIDVEVQQLKHEFVTGYNNAVDEWCLENPEYEQAIRAGALPKEEVQKRIGFEYQVFMVQPTDDEQSAKRLDRKVDELGDDLISEVVREANEFYVKRLGGKQSIATSTGPTLKKLRDKVDGLSFLNSAFSPLVELLDQTLSGYETHGKGRRTIQGMFFFQIMAAVLIMCDRERIEEYAGGSLSVDEMAKSLTRDELSSLESGDESSETEQTGDVEKPSQQPSIQPDVETEEHSVASEVISTDNTNSLIDDFDAFLASKNEADSNVSNTDSFSKEELDVKQVTSDSEVLGIDDSESKPDQDSPSSAPEDDDCYF